MDTIDNNRLIALFMGENYDDQIASICSLMYDTGYRSIEIINNIEPCIPYNHYHSSWDWLMPVVDRILFMKRKNKGHYNYLGPIENGLLQVDISEVFNGCVSFIKWYNINL